METMTKPRPESVRGTIYALVAAAGFGALMPITKMLLQGLSPLQTAFLMLVGAGVGAGAVWVATRNRSDAPSRSDARNDQAEPRMGAGRIALVGALNAGWMACLAFGVSAVPAPNASLLMGCVVAATTVCAWMSRRRSFCYKASAAVGLIAIAAVVLLWNGPAHGAFVPESLLIVASCIMIAIENDVEQTAQAGDMPKLLSVKSFAAAIVLLIAMLAFDGVPAASLPFAGDALLAGFICCGLCPAMLLAAQRDLGEARASSCFSLAPFVALVISWSIYGLELDPLLFGALALMALGVWLDLDDGIFHERAYSEYDRELVELYASEASAFSLDRMHRRTSHSAEGN